MRRSGQDIFKKIGSIIHGKICYLLLTKEIQSFFCKTQLNFV